MNTRAPDASLRYDLSRPGISSTPAVAETKITEPNLAVLFRARTERYGDLARWRQRSGREWRRVTYRENQRLVNRVMCGLDELGARPGDAIGILSGTRWEWLVADWAITGLGAFTATLYATLTPDAISFILNDSGARYVFIDNAQQYEKVRRIRHQLPQLEKIVIFDENARILSDPMVISFAALMQLSGRSDEEADAFAAERVRQIQPDDCAGLVYTSGTTGQPKGVVTTHRMLLAELAGAHSMLTTVHPGCKDVLWLPLAHGMGRLEHIFTFEFGGETIVIPSVLSLMRDLGEVQPDLMLAVPRMYEKAHMGMLTRVATLSAPRRKLFDWALKVGERAVLLRQERRPVPLILRLQRAVADRLVFRRLREAFGGRLQLAVSGGAPLDASVVTFFHAIGIPLLEAWGLTETTTALTINKVDWFRIGTVGTLFPGHDIRIAPDGEILVRGPCVFSRYHNNPEATAEALDAEGWLHTGDIGSLDRDGFLTIIDRKKDLIVNSGGDNIAPQHIEALLDTIPEVAHACVYGDQKSYLVALLTLDWAAVRTWATEAGLDVSDIRKTALSPELRAYLDKGVARMNARLQIYERVRSYGILVDDFTQENDLLTPTQKIRRKQIIERYRAQFEQLYAPTPSGAHAGVKQDGR
ncbi:MAG TPA: long-chain fatty acid--CoA ligase [Ktedonobacterales bacterium]|nr:long-chain fatty acid--CoA ligase [Ktedonobacterales bacterium]